MRLNAAFSEWMMGLPAGWVTGIMATSADPRGEPSKISRLAALRLIGNGVVPQQGAAALRWLLTDTHPEFSEGPGRCVLD